ncbi:hypothetical protein BG011_005136 [Mortierella polycephala]|uniref:Protein kinase domain-containing protein n=1 Tax=Mortierella polycephala TaxID=41804 RepID=A0A9P6QFR2_9FUNG|nr:hypothetical protein BG011_005136 [Mortierella polycephala]
MYPQGRQKGEITAVVPLPIVYFALVETGVKIPFPESAMEEGSRFVTRVAKYYNWNLEGTDGARVMLNMATSYAVVKIASGRRYAVKIISKKLMQGKEHMIRNEIAVLSRISVGHANILTLSDYFESYNNMYFVTELAEGGELFDRICSKGSYYECDAAQLVRTVCNAVAYLHEQGIVHRDLKPENLLFKTADDDSELLIADFGLSRIIDHDVFHLLTTTCGTPGYMAPEILQKSGYGKPVDMWALGVITYFLLCGQPPFDRENTSDEIYAIQKAEYKFEPAEYWEGVSETARSFVASLLTVDPSRRMTAAEALHHPWLQEAGAHQDDQHHRSPVADVPQQEDASESTMDVDDAGPRDLLPNMMARMRARTKFRNAVQAVRAINKLRGSLNDLRCVQQEEISHVLSRGEDEDMV